MSDEMCNRDERSVTEIETDSVKIKILVCKHLSKSQHCLNSSNNGFKVRFLIIW